MLRPEVIEATSPTVTTDPAGIFVSFNRGQWSKAVVVVNGAYTFDAGSIMPGDHVIAWNRFQGPSIVLSQPMVKLITLRGEVDGKPREIDYHTSMGAGYVATFHVGDE